MENANTLFTVLIVYGGVILAAFWLALILWAYRDMRARSRDTLAQVLVAVMVALLTVPGAFIYLMTRPRETLAEAYERSLEEEALLQEIEEKPSCPGCGQRVQEGWQVCPHCHTRLKKACVNCGATLELPWSICPQCATLQPQAQTEDPAAYTHNVGLIYDSPASASVTSSARARRARRRSAAYTSESGQDDAPPAEPLQFVDTDPSDDGY